jgi:hypothetical protein
MEEASGFTLETGVSTTDSPMDQGLEVEPLRGLLTPVRVLRTEAQGAHTMARGDGSERKRHQVG